MIAKQLCAALFLCGMILHLSKSIELTVTRCPTSRGIKNEKNLLVKVEDIKHEVRKPEEVCEMILSHGNITYLPNGLFKNFSRLLKLSLADNDIHKISANAFNGLTSLKTLDLTENPNLKWNTSGISHHIPKLKTLHMTSSLLKSNATSSPWKTGFGSSSMWQPLPWKPVSSLLTLPQLREIKGVSWSRFCSNCSLIKSENKTLTALYANKTYTFLKGYACRSEVTSPSKFIRRFAKYRFLATCVLDNQKCFKSEVKVVVLAPCRKITLSVMYLQYLLGPIAIILNLLVIGTVANSKRLRRNHDMLLVSNIAIGDFFNGLYSVLIISVHVTRTFHEMEEFARHYCSFIGSFWILGLSLSVSFSLILTIERFKCVVRLRNRQSRMTAMELVLASSVCWLWALCATIFPGFGIGHYHLNTYCIPVFPIKSIPVQYFYSLTISGMSGLMYLVTIPLYIRMYIFVRKSSKNMRVRADIELAKRVFTLVLTNMMFFFIPVIISLVFAKVNRNTSELSREVSEVVNSALPLLCLTINSVANPVLYSFRSRLFRKEVAMWAPFKIQPRTGPSNLKLCSGSRSRSAYVIQKSTSVSTL